jgi:hypothetical protein
MFHSTTFARTARFATRSNGAGSIRTMAPEGLALADIERVTPSVFATAPHESRSERFVAIPTSDVVQGLMRQGFVPMEARQGGSRDIGKRSFTKHLLRLRHPDMGAHEGLGGLFPEVVIVNGNDGTSSYQIMAGMFRMICTNGLIAGDMFDMHRVRHTGRADQVIDNVIDASFRVISEVPQVVDAAQTMGALELTAGEQRAFATAALRLRWDGEDEQAPISADQVLAPRRMADNGADLWRTMNRVQEGLMRGGQRYRSDPSAANPRGQRRVVGEVNGIDQNRTINRALWTLADEMAKLKA